jgi:hypothetical protein
MNARSIACPGILALALAACGGAVQASAAPTEPAATSASPASASASSELAASPASASGELPTSAPVATTTAPSGAGAPTSGTNAADAAEAAAALLHGARLDLQGRCAPLREGLPAGAVGAITCTPQGTVAALVTMVILDTQPQLMAAYGAVVSDAGIPPFSHRGRCEAGRATEGGYVPGDGHPGAIPDERVACWTDDAGIAHSVTTSLPFVLLRVDGRPGASTADVGLFPMLGNRDQPGGPTLWAQEPMSPEK